MKAVEVLENGIKISHRHRCGPQGRCLLKAKQIPIFLILAKNTEIKSHLEIFQLFYDYVCIGKIIVKHPQDQYTVETL